MIIKIKYRGALSGPDGGRIDRAIKNKLERTRDTVSKYTVKAWRDFVNMSSLSVRAKNRYSNAITPYKSPRIGAYIQEKIAVLLEKGWKPFDMKPGLLAGRMFRRIPVSGGEGTVIRTVSTNSPPTSWKHPGFKGAKVENRVRRVFQSIVQKAIKDVGSS